MSEAFYRGHLKAMRRSRPMAALPVTFSWPSNDPRSRVCRVGLGTAALELRLEQWDQVLQLSAKVTGARFALEIEEER